MVLEALITTGSTVAVSSATYLFARKKYLAEIEKLKQENNRSEIENLREVIKTQAAHYDAQIELLNKELAAYREMHERDFRDLMKLKSIVQKVVNEGCKRNPCLKRMRYDDSDLNYLFGNDEEQQTNINRKSEEVL